MNTQIIIAISLFLSIIMRTLIIEIGKSKRINQLKNVDKSKIESIGKYEKNSKLENSSQIIIKSNNQQI